MGLLQFGIPKLWDLWKTPFFVIITKVVVHNDLNDHFTCLWQNSKVSKIMNFSSRARVRRGRGACAAWKHEGQISNFYCLISAFSERLRILQELYYNLSIFVAELLPDFYKFSEYCSEQDFLNEVGSEKQKRFNLVSRSLVDVYCCFLYDYFNQD